MKIDRLLHLRDLRSHSLVRLARNMSSAAAMAGLLATLAGAMQLAAPLVAHGQKSSVPNRTVVAENYGKLPLSFEANQGQSDRKVKFLSRGRGYSLFLTDSSAVLALIKQDSPDIKPTTAVSHRLKPSSSPQARTTDVVRMELAGASRNLHVKGADRLPGVANYFIGNDPAKWHSGVPTYAKVWYTNVYPGIDLVYYGNQRQLEYDFLVAPGANPKPIRLQFAGARKLKLTADGDLTVSAANGEIAFHKPAIYQLKDGQRRPVEGQFSVLEKNAVGFTVGQYDHTKPLVIDPVLVYSTYLGGSNNDDGLSIALDSSGDAYVAGIAESTNFPVTAGAFQTVNNAVANAFITKLNPTGTALLYSTYLGGGGTAGGLGDGAHSIAVDGSGDAYVTGEANSTNFPVTAGAFQIANNAAVSAYQYSNAFVTELNTTGTALLYSTYLGGSNDDYGLSIAVDSSGDAYVAGIAESTNFPVTAGAFQTVNNSTGNIAVNAFVTKLNPTGTALLYSTYLGGSGYDQGAGIAVDGSGDAYVAGEASSANFPVTTGAFQTVNNAAPYVTAFITKLNPTGTALLYSTYLGGNGGEGGYSIVVDSASDAYVTGFSLSTNFPVTPGAFQTVNNHPNDGGNAFITKFNPTGTALLYSTYLGGNGGDEATGIALDSAGDAYVTGAADSTNFPVTAGAVQTVNNAAASGQSNAFVTELNPTGTALLYSTYLGGSSTANSPEEGDAGGGIAVDSSGDAYVAGITSSTNFPVTASAFQTEYNATASSSGSNAFIAKLNLSPTLSAPAVTVTPSSSSITTAQPLTVTVEVSGASGSPTPTGSVTLTSGAYSSDATALSSGSATIDVSAGSLATGTDMLTATYTPDSSSTSTYESSTGTNSVTVTTPVPLASLSVASLTFASQATGTTSAAQTVTLTNSGSATLTLSPITASGDFASTSNCGASLSTEDSCTISVTFTPTATGPLTGTLTIADNATGSPQTVALAGTGDSVSMTSSVTSLSISSPGGSATATLTVAPVQGFSGAVTLACAVTYQGQGKATDPPTCTLNPNQVTVSSTSSPTTTLTISTTTASAKAELPKRLRYSGEIVCALLFLGLFPRRSRKYRTGLFLIILLIVATNLTVGCSQGSTNTGSTGSSSNPGSATGAYSVVVTATGSSKLSSVTIPLNIQ